MKCPRALGRLQLLFPAERRRIFIVDEFYVTAERYPSEAPAGAIPVVKAIYFRAKADRKRLDGDAAPACDKEMA
jgi:hypothetical protein